MDYMPLRKITQEHVECRLKVRVVRFREEFSDSETNKLQRFECIFLDEEGTAMDVVMPPKHITKLRARLTEDRVYYIQYVDFAKAKTIYRPVDHPHMAVFTGYTVIHEVNNVPRAFPLYACSIAPFSVLRQRRDRIDFTSGHESADQEPSFPHSPAVKLEQEILHGLPQTDLRNDLKSNATASHKDHTHVPLGVSDLELPPSKKEDLSSDTTLFLYGLAKEEGGSSSAITVKTDNSKTLLPDDVKPALQSIADPLLTAPTIMKPKLVRTAYVSRSLILKEVMASLNLRVHDVGFDNTLSALNMKTAWMKVDLPRRNKPGTKDSTTLFGQPQSTEKAAVESAAQAVLEFYCGAREVNIDDFSHTLIKKKQEQLNAANFYFATMQDRAVQLVLERDAARAMIQHSTDSKIDIIPRVSQTFIANKQTELNSDFFYDTLQEKINALIKDRTNQNRRSVKMLHKLAATCAEFSDLLPIQMLSSDEMVHGHTGTAFMFKGDQADPSRMDKLALALLDILADGIVEETENNIPLY